MFYLKSATSNYGINIPTDVNEITAEHLKAMTEHINLAPYHCVVAQVMQVDLFKFIMSNNTNDGVKVIPLLAKINIPSDMKDPIQANIGDRLILPGSVLEHGLHAFVPTASSYGAVKGYVEKDAVLRTSLSNKTYAGNLKHKGIKDYTTKDVQEDCTNEVCILEFKIINLSHISGTMQLNPKIDDPFYQIDKTIN